MKTRVREAGKDPDELRARLGFARWSDVPAEVIARLADKAEATIADRRRRAGARVVAERHLRAAIAALDDAGDGEACRAAARLEREAARLATEATSWHP